MFAFCAVAASILAVTLSVSAGYFRSLLASRIRLAVSLVLSVGGLACAAVSAALFYRSDGAQLEWAENAFSMFTRFAVWITLIVAATLTLSVFFGKKLRDRIMRISVASLYTVGAAMLTALFSTLCTDPETLVHSYVQAFGIGCALIPLISFAAEELRSLTQSRKDKTRRAEQNNK